MMTLVITQAGHATSQAMIHRNALDTLICTPAWSSASSR